MMRNKNFAFGARSSVAYLSLLFGLVSLPLAIVRYPFYPITFGSFAIYFASLVLRETSANVKLKLMARIAMMLGVAALMIIVLLWLLGKSGSI